MAFALPLAGCVSANDARLRDFERILASHDSATAALSEWCRVRGIANPPEIRAVQVAAPEPMLPAGLRELLELGPDERPRVRHVRLVCGQTVLSEAQNVYAASRLPDAMIRTLETTEAPFGKVIAPLGFTRERLASYRGQAADCPDDTVLSQRALLRLRDGRPVSALLECYSRAILAIGPQS